MFLKNATTRGIKFYHNYLFPLVLCQCRFYPSCSEYMREAIDHRGIFGGILRGLARFSRCHPWSKGGYDPYNREAESI